MEQPELPVLLGQNIVSRRQELNLSRKELAVKLDITIDAMMKIEKGQIAPKVSRLQDIANVLECSVSSLFHKHSEIIDEKIREIAEGISTLPCERQKAVLKIMYASLDAFQHEK